MQTKCPSKGQALCGSAKTGILKLEMWLMSTPLYLSHFGR
jgi:hypothetical protein